MKITVDNKCPSCGANVKFNPTTQKWDCEYCGNSYEIEEFEKQQEKETKENLGFEIDEYTCPNCGATVVTDANTVATHCVYCGNTTIMKNRLQGEFKPDKLIPFKTTKEEAIEEFKKNVKKRWFAPSDFHDEKNIEKITGVYIPFWLYDSQMNGNIQSRATQIRRWSSGNYDYTETSTFRCTRSGELEIEDLPVDSSTKFKDEIMDSIEPYNYSEFKPFLLYGVTGSGKTEVYMHIIDEVLKRGKEVIVLVPEISLTPQLTSIFKSRFKGNVAILHSRLSDGEKYDEWRRIERKEVKIAVGARSAIFAPFTNLGLIVIDEEHSSTYHQENMPTYNAIDVALKRCKNHNALLVLGSATPSIESYTRAKLNIYTLLELKNRVNKQMPTVKLIDMCEEFKKGNRIISDELKNKITERLNNNEQVIILLNRRGYTTSLVCTECGEVIKCPNCDIPLVLHKTSSKLKCHYCNYETNTFELCPKCKSKNLKSLGFGTEKLEETIKEMFKARVIRMDVDTTSKKGAHEEIINAFAEHKYDILIGTQMIAKGLDFKDVTLVGVINGDAGLNVPDFRSSERTFQLLNQVSGRSGRSTKKGEVIIQGFNIDHYSIRLASINDYKTFYDYEMKTVKDSEVDIKPASQEHKELKEIVEKIAKKLDIKGYAKMDFRICNGKYYLIEVNSQVSFHPEGEFITCAKKDGYEFNDIVSYIVSRALTTTKKINSVGIRGDINE